MRPLSSPRGVTLIELMVVVAILGILAAIGSVAYGRYIKAGKIERLKAIAMQIESGQERYRSRNNAYYPAGGGLKTWASDSAEIRTLLDFANEPPQGVSINIRSWPSGGSCTECAGLPVDLTKIGWAVIVTQDLNSAASSTNDTTVYLSNTASAPVLQYEGE